MLILVLIAVVAVIWIFMYAKLWSARESQKSDLVHAAALKAHSIDEPVDVPSGTTAAAAAFFEIHGTTEKKYESIINPVAYAGYVNFSGEEAVVVIFRHNAGLTVTTHETPYHFGNDFISLMQKRQFMQEILQAYKSKPRQ